ncbi:hypothetical protein GJ496_004904 [Pomphorhynchus laevis]|nr:hypothetical protein GJ496_004904 [Pomphorhynchus laevis]
MTEKNQLTNYFHEGALNKKLDGLNKSADCIQTASLWIIHHREHHERIVKCWYSHMQSATSEKRLLLFYLANDIIQNCIRKHAHIFHEQFLEYVTKVIPYLRCKTIRKEVERILKIWKDRRIYSQADISKWLNDLRKDNSPECNKVIADYKPQQLCQMLETCQLQSEQFSAKQAALASFELNEPANKFRERSQGAVYRSEIQSVKVRCQHLANMIRNQLKMRKKMISMLEQSLIFYEMQHNDAKVVLTAYKNFGTKVNDLKRKLDELKNLLPKSRHSAKRKRSSESGDNLTTTLFPQSMTATFPANGHAVHHQAAMLVAYSSQVMPSQQANSSPGVATFTATNTNLPTYFYQTNADIDCRFGSADQLYAAATAKDPRHHSSRHK